MSLLGYVRSAAGGVLFDDEYPSIHMAAKGTHAVTTGSQASPVGTRSTLTISGFTAPILALRPRNTNIAANINYRTRSGSNDSYLIQCSGDTSQLIDWWVFDIVPPPSGLLELFRNGVRTWSYGVNPFMPRATLQGATDNQPVNFPAPSGKQYAAVQGGLSGLRTWVGGAGGNLNRYEQQSRWDAVYRYGDGVAVRQTILDRAGNAASPGPDITYGPRNYLIVDVTNY